MRGGVVMAQFCRYCEHMHVTAFGFCDQKNRFYPIEHLTHTNNCALFAYNPIDVLRRNRYGHQPRVKEDTDCDPNQTTIFDLIE